MTKPTILEQILPQLVFDLVSEEEAVLENQSKRHEEEKRGYFQILKEELLLQANNVDSEAEI